MTKDPILVLGGTGKTGGRVVSQLRAQGAEVRAVSRPRFDWTDASTWDDVLTGARAVYLVPFDGRSFTAPFVERAVALGVERVVLLSGRGVDTPGYADPDNPLVATHVDGERAVRGSGIEWTVLRPGWFAQNFSEGFFRDAVLAGELRLPAEDGAVSFVDADDIASVAVAALTGDGHAGQTYELSGPRALTFAQAAAEISEATGRRIGYVPLTREAFVAELIAQGLSAGEARDSADIIEPIRRGMDSHLSDGVRRALGRDPRDFTEFAKAAAAAGAWDAAG
ncbi:NAD(P)H-binding protein [Pseudonocardia acaciae]|uniref:NAD(P)H-binding protein n=1 Tax=Pseudonocardia acaciae TaxID=551276 RepID=UPI00048F5004|nr:NAD(P)H-binding protein [Pseudonocardia acaciae]